MVSGSQRLHLASNGGCYWHPHPINIEIKAGTGSQSVLSKVIPQTKGRDRSTTQSTSCTPAQRESKVIFSHHLYHVLAFVSNEITIISTQTLIHRHLDPMPTTAVSDKNLTDLSGLGPNLFLHCFPVPCNSQQLSISGTLFVQKPLFSHLYVLDCFNQRTAEHTESSEPTWVKRAHQAEYYATRLHICVGQNPHFFPYQP